MTIKYLLVGFDGLRPDMITPDLMPRLHQHGMEGVVFENHRSTFPTETYVNLPSLVTGATPSRHGMIANQYLDLHVDSREPFRGYSVAKIEKAQRAYKGHLYGTLSLGEILHKAQRRMAVISTNSAGSTRLKHHQICDSEHLSMACHSSTTSWPPQEVASILEKLGSPAPITIPDLEGTSYATDVFLEHVAQGEFPDLTILWYGEPDESYHTYGIGSPQNQLSLRHVDTQFGRVLDWWENSDMRERLQIVVTSDHGHITQRHKVNIGAQLKQSGFKVARHLEDGADLALLSAYAGGIWVRNKNPEIIIAIGEALMSSDECGMIFSAPRNEVEGVIPGSFSRQMVMADHPRSPDIYYILNTNNEPNEYGYTGTCSFENELSVGAGIHGGLHPKELQSVFIATGTQFGNGQRFSCHSGILDIAPTILHGLDIIAPQRMEGQVLSSAFIKHPPTDVHPIPETFETGFGPYRQILHRTRQGEACYLDSGARIS